MTTETADGTPPTTRKSWKIPPANERLYQANLEAFGPELAQVLNKSPATEIPVDPDVRVEGLKNPTYLVIIGFSSLGVVESARKSKKDISHILIIEPSLSVFKQTLQRCWVGDLAKEANVDILIGIPPEEMFPHVYKIFTAMDPKLGSRAMRCMSPEIVIDPFVYADEKNRPIADQITKVVLDVSKQIFLAMGCGADSFARWEQMIRNEDNMGKANRIAPLFGKFEDTPVIVVGAGPSMKEFIDAYHEHKLADRALIIACDAALPKLLSHNVRPHIVTRCERKLTTIFRGVDREATKGIHYAWYPWCSPEYMDLFESTFLMFRDNGVCKWSGYDPGSVNGGVSSANAAFELAFLLGAKHIILSGVDLCFIGGRSHVEGTEVEFDIEKSKPKWQEIEGNHGKPVTTIPVWFRCLNEYRTSISKFSGQAKVYNTSLEGARIDGTEVRSFGDLADRGVFANASQSAPSQRIAERLEKHPPGYADSLKAKRKETAKYMRQVVADFDKLFLFMDDALLTARREEEKVVQAIQTHVDPKEFFDNYESIKANLTTVYKEPCRQIDEFKKKYYTQESFANILLDICQLDLFQTENKCCAIKNTIPHEHERLRVYAVMHIAMFHTVRFYAEKLADLLEHGPSLEVDYEVREVEGVPC